MMSRVPICGFRNRHLAVGELVMRREDEKPITIVKDTGQYKSERKAVKNSEQHH